jgi:hypothetical protein
MDTAFKVVSVSGQSNLTSVQYDAETLTFIAGTGVNITTDPSTNSLTISATGGGGGQNLISSSFTFGDTAPEIATHGDRWFNSTNGRLYTYFNDGDSSQWVELGGNQ